MILLDTHAWIWWTADTSKLSAKARRHLEQASELGVCVISCWEVAMLVSKKRIQLDRDVLVWIRQALTMPKIKLLPLTPEISVAAAGLGVDFAGDPADRMIAASALELRAALVTKDRRLRTFKQLTSIW